MARREALTLRKIDRGQGSAKPHLGWKLAFAGAFLLCGGCGAEPQPNPYAEYEATLKKSEIELPKIRAMPERFVAEAPACAAAATSGIGTRFTITFVGDSASELPGVLLIRWYKADGRSKVNEVSASVESQDDTGTAKAYFRKSPGSGNYLIEVVDPLHKPQRSTRVELRVVP